VSIRDARVYQAFKYLVYTLLSINVALFLREDWLASSHTFAAGITPGQLVEAFSATVDTLAWVVLLLLFERETWVLDDDRITGAVEWWLHGVRAFCYLFILWAFWGYCVKLQLFHDVTLLTQMESLCALADGGWAFVTTLDEYLAIDPTNCAALSADSTLWQVGSTGVVADEAQLTAAQRLAWTDVINAGTWILVVLVLEADVRLQTRGRFEGLIFRASYAVKAILYTTLLAAAIYWGLEGDFLDFWDAFLWLLAFAFIELNVFDWHQETTEDTADEAAAS
jgi:hypothetical protein